MPNLNNNVSNTRLELIDRKHLNLNGVVSVDGFSEESIKLTLNNDKLIITGSGIKITGYSKGSGTLSAEGDFVSFKYNEKKAPLFKRLFK